MTSTLPKTGAGPLGGLRRPLGRFPTVVFVIAVVLAVVGAEASYVAYGRYRPVYESASSIAFTQTAAEVAARDAGIIQKLAAIRVQYADLVHTDVITLPVASKLGLSPGQIAGSVIAIAPPDSLLLRVGAQDVNQAQAQAITQAVAQQVVTYVKAVQDAAGVPAKKQVTATIVTPSRGAAKIAPTAKRRLSVAVLAGVLIFVVVFGAGALIRRRA